MIQRIFLFALLLNLTSIHAQHVNGRLVYKIETENTSLPPPRIAQIDSFVILILDDLFIYTNVDTHRYFPIDYSNSGRYNLYESHYVDIVNNLSKDSSRLAYKLSEKCLHDSIKIEIIDSAVRFKTTFYSQCGMISTVHNTDSLLTYNNFYLLDTNFVVPAEIIKNRVIEKYTIELYGMFTIRYTLVDVDLELYQERPTPPSKKRKRKRYRGKRINCSWK